MSTLEKAITLLKDMPKQKIETVYAFIQFINCQTDENFSSPIPEKKEKAKSILGIAHEYANPELIETELRITQIIQERQKEPGIY